MIRILVMSVVTFIAILAWISAVFLITSEGWLKSPLVKSDSPVEFFTAVEKSVVQTHSGNFAMILIEDGRVAERYFMSTGASVDGASVFQVASLGKWLTAWGVMLLVEEGAVDLDRPVDEYLTRWKLPNSGFDNSGVTVRRLLSHTSGLNDGLGYDGFDHPDKVQSLAESLTRALDASPGNTGKVELGATPGSEWNYSGGGYTMLQLLIEDVTQQPFSEFMSERIFAPLGLNRTTYNYNEALSLGLAENFNLAGKAEPFRWYTALAATSLFTSADDLAKFIAAQTTLSNQSVLSETTLELMRTPHAAQMGTNIWGLGLMLYAPNNVGGYIVGHDGNNGPAINTVARFDPATGDGIVILSTGSKLLATELAGEWVFWKTGRIDNLMFLLLFETMAIWMGTGSLLIILVTLTYAWRRRKSKTA